ncbi:hypothetical protein GWK47_039437 [Chionoecetes opilio]|uniref:Uncharacterized protein n=1 Tax=Chionoecetes opilio TaxID=41210 RepID=A0A8J4YKE3_CHIOP|nr:hypothetical protein GWK47_039437 [Chionoecetes opilio]
MCIEVRTRTSPRREGRGDVAAGGDGGSAGVAVLQVRHSYWSSRGVPSPPALPFLGHYHKAFFISRTTGFFYNEMYKKFRDSPMFACTSAGRIDYSGAECAVPHCRGRHHGLPRSPSPPSCWPRKRTSSPPPDELRQMVAEHGDITYQAIMEDTCSTPAPR